MFFRFLKESVTLICLIGLVAIVGRTVNPFPVSTVAGRFYVVDGDTLSQSHMRYRLRGIDAPELEQECERAGKRWACGAASRAYLVELTGTKSVRCENTGKDKYGRGLVVCRNGKRDLNAAMVRAGMAVGYGGYQAEELSAAIARRGIWAGRFERPQDWRKRHKHS